MRAEMIVWRYPLLQLIDVVLLRLWRTLSLYSIRHHAVSASRASPVIDFQMECRNKFISAAWTAAGIGYETVTVGADCRLTFCSYTRQSISHAFVWILPVVSASLLNSIIGFLQPCFSLDLHFASLLFTLCRDANVSRILHLLIFHCG